jgi:hypothetical protein
MNMPVQTRKYFIMRHNKETDELNTKYSSNKGNSISGEATKGYTQMSMTDYRRIK